MKRNPFWRSAILLTFVFVGALLVYAWTPLPVKQDRLVFMPGSQQGSVNLESATRYNNCHGGYNKAVEPAHNWRGGMMASVGVAAPTGLTATVAKKSVKLAWTPVSGVSGCKVYYAQGGKHTLRATVTTAAYTDSGLLPGQTYTYAVTAFLNCTGAAVGESACSNTASAVPTR
jgi:hypothetical protein